MHLELYNQKNVKANLRLEPRGYTLASHTTDHMLHKYCWECESIRALVNQS